MGSAQSARGIQLRGSVGRLVRGWRGVSSFPAASLARAFSGVHFLRGGAPRPAPVRLGKARGEGGPRREPRALQRPPGPYLAASGGRGLSTRCALSPRGEGRGPPLPAWLSSGADCSQCAPTASRRPGGDRLS